MNKKKEKIKKNLIRIFLTILGCFLFAFSINTFVVPYKLVSGGIAGIGLLVQYLTNISSGILVAILNIPIFILGYKQINKDFILYSFIGTVALSFFLVFLKKFNINLNFQESDILLSCIYGGLLCGIGSGLVLRNGASTGGLDIICVILKQKIGMSVPTISFAFNIILVVLGAINGGVKIGLYTLVCMCVSAKVCNIVLEGINNKKSLFIISEKDEELSKSIMNEVNRGVTYIKGEGAYTGKDKKIIYCVVNQYELVKIYKIINEIDPNSFVSIQETNTVFGNGFKKIKTI